MTTIKYASLLLLAAGAAAQDAVNTTVLTELATALTGAGYTQFAGAAAAIANTTLGQSILKTITNGDANYTIFVPTDAALGAAPQGSLDDPDALATLLSYHISPGVYLNETEIYTSPNNSVLPTFFNATDAVNLQGNATQVLVLTNTDGDIRINNQNGTTINKVTVAANRFTIAEINHVLTPPGSLESVLKANNLTLFAQAAQTAGIYDGLKAAKGLTIFAPTDAAVTAALTKLGANATNATLVATILQNHIINGTALYSSELDTRNTTSAAGEALKFWVFNNTITVYSGDSGNLTANVTRRDVLAANGVVHVVNGVLANTDRDDGAAQDAYNSATKSANDAGPTGGADGNTGPVGGSPGDDKGDAALPRLAAALWTALGAAVVGALAVSSL